MTHDNRRMSSIELRFRVPDDRRAAVQRALQARPSRTVSVAAPWPEAVAGTWRLHTRQLNAGLSTIAVGLLCGTLHTDAGEQTVVELTLALENGPLDGLLRLADRWVERFGLWLDVRGPAERGGDWQSRAAAPRVYSATVPALTHDMDADAALRSMVATILQQVLPNTAALAAGRGASEHVHQTRIGLRRLRTVLRGFESWSTAVQPGWHSALGRLFRSLNAARDRDTLLALLPQLQRAGGPTMTPPAAADPPDLAPVLRSPDCNRLMLRLIGFAFGPARPDLARKGRPERLAKQRLSRWHRRLCGDARVFGGLGDAERHDVRKRLKRLRYAVEAVSALLPQQATAGFLARLRKAQDVLGDLNDSQVAQITFLSRAESDAHAWFALGWLAARRVQLVPQATRALQRVPQRPRPLRR